MKFLSTSVFISAVYLASAVLAQGPPIISIISPLSNTKYKAGQEAIIAWVNPRVQTIDQIVLAKGSSNALQPIMTIATNVNANDMKYVWEIPEDLESGTEYALEFGTSPDLAFAGPFTIEPSDGSSAPSGNQTAVSVNKNNAAVAAASGVSSNPSASNSGTSPNQTSSPNSAAHASGSNKQVASQTMAALGMAAVVAAQFF